MAKNKNRKISNAEDYLAQVEWENQQSQRQPKYPLPWYMEPKRTYKRVFSFRNSSAKKIPVPVKIVLIVMAFGIAYFLYRNDTMLLISLSGMGIFIFFMIRDATKKPKDDNKFQN